MAGGWFTKQADFLTAANLNDVNDSVVGGQIQSVPSAVPASQGIQTLPGDRIILDDATAFALSDTTIGTLYGGIYMYVQATWTTAAAAFGTAAFYKAADVGNLAPTSPNTTAYVVYSDAQPSTTVPSYFAGVFISAPTKNNYCWIQIQGMATCLFDSAVTAAAAGNWVSVKVSSAVASCFDVGAAVGVVTLSALVGTAVGLPVISTASKVSIWRGFGRL
jgi:hypothetical protein